MTLEELIKKRDEEKRIVFGSAPGACYVLSRPHVSVGIDNRLELSVLVGLGFPYGHVLHILTGERRFELEDDYALKFIMIILPFLSDYKRKEAQKELDRYALPA